MSLTDSRLGINRAAADYIRGLAIVCVVLGHILGGTFGMISVHLTSILGIGGVTIFLLLSGYGLYSSYRQSGLQGKTYWDKKIEKVFAPYAVITVLYYLYMKACGTAPGAVRLLYNLLCIDYTRAIDGTMWYMSFLLLWYLAFFLVFYFKGSPLGKIFLLTLLGFCFRAYWLNTTFQNCAWQFSTNAFSFPCGVGLGYAVEQFNRSRISEKCKKWLCLGIRLAVFAASVAVLILGIWQIVSMEYWVIGMAMFGVLYVPLCLPKREIKPLKWLGGASFLIYLIEGKMIGIWNRSTFLREHPAMYLIGYAAATVAMVYVYRFVGSLCGRIGDRLAKKETDAKA